jgi:endonuclease/exonuclease/phosphatase (EEP) superfamily protein YafD
MTETIVHGLGILIIVASLLPLLPVQHWFVRTLEFPRQHILVLNILTTFSLLTIGVDTTPEFLLLAGLLICLFGIVYRIFPYTELSDVESEIPSPQEIQTKNYKETKILGANIRAKNNHYEKFLRLVNKNNPDIILVIEATKAWQLELSCLKEEYPYSIENPQDNTYGMLLYSKYPLENTRVENLVDKNVPSFFTDLILSKNHKVHLVCLHPRPPRPKEASSVEKDGELMKVASYLENKKHKAYTIVLGDLNDVAWSHTTRLFLRKSKLLDPRIGRGFFNTFPSSLSWMGFPIDHVFHGEKIAIKSIDVLEDIGSDHLPYTSNFLIEAYTNKFNKQFNQVTKQTDDADERQIDQMIKEAEKWDGPKQRINAYD